LADRSSQMLSAESTVKVERFADCRFRGQSYELTIPVEQLSIEMIERTFRQAYESRYGHCPQGRAIEVVTLRLRRTGRSTALELPPVVPRKMARQTARVVLPGGEAKDIAVMDRAGLAFEGEVDGPMMLVDPDCTTLVLAGWAARATECGSLMLERRN